MGTPKKPELKSIDFEAYVEDNRDNLTRAELRDLNKMKNLIDSGEYGVEFNPMLSSYNLVDKEGNIYNEQTGLKLEGDILRRTFGGEKKRISGLMGDIYSNKKYLSKYKYPATEPVKDEDKDASITTQDPQQTASEQKENKPVLPSKSDEGTNQSKSNASANQSKSNEGTGVDEQQTKPVNGEKPTLSNPVVNSAEELKKQDETKPVNVEKPALNSTEEYPWSRALFRTIEPVVPIYGHMANTIYDIYNTTNSGKKDEVKQPPVVASSIGGYTKEEQAKIAEELKKKDKTKPAIVSPGALAAVGAATVAGGVGLYYGGKYARTIPSKIYNWFNNTFYPAPANPANEIKLLEAANPTAEAANPTAEVVKPTAEAVVKKVSRKPALEAAEKASKKTVKPALEVVEAVAKKASKKATQVSRVASNASKARKAAGIVKKVSKAID